MSRDELGLCERCEEKVGIYDVIYFDRGQLICSICFEGYSEIHKSILDNREENLK